MAVYPNLVRGVYTYTNDAGTDEAIILSLEIATAAGFSPATPGALPALPPRGSKFKVRGVYGKTDVGTGGRAFLPCPTIGQMMTIFTSGSFSINGVAYDVTGRVGEKTPVAL